MIGGEYGLESRSRQRLDGADKPWCVCRCGYHYRFLITYWRQGRRPTSERLASRARSDNTPPAERGCTARVACLPSFLGSSGGWVSRYGGYLASGAPQMLTQPLVSVGKSG